MAGSRRNFQYVTDGGDIYLFNGDESNVEAVHGTEANIVAGNEDLDGIPRNITPRRVVYINGDGSRSISVVAATLTRYNSPPATIADPIDGSATLSYDRQIPQKRRRYRNLDTGLTDGDAPQ